MLEKVKKTIAKYKLICKNDRIVVGVSGGSDSLALLYILNSLKKEYKLTLHIAHLDHMLRKDSGKDRLFVENLAHKLNLPVNAVNINIKAIARRGSIEEISRNARLAFFFKIAKDIKTTKIALGHNLDDQAETVLMRLIRGTGLHGLSGMLPKKEIYGYQIIRPLIEIKRREIDCYLKKKNIRPRIDTSNMEDIYLRNKIRHKLIPLLEKEYNLNLKELLSNTAENVGYDYDYLNRAAYEKARNLGRKIDLGKFLKLHPAMQRMILRLNIVRLKGDTRRITFGHIKEIEDLIANRPGNSIVDLPGKISVIKKKNFLSFYRR